MAAAQLHCSACRSLSTITTINTQSSQKMVTLCLHLHILHTYVRGQNDQNILSKEVDINISHSLHIVAAVCTRLHPSTAGTILFLNWIIGAHISRQWQCSHTAPGARLPSPRPELPEVTHPTSPLTSSHQPQDACSLFLSTSAAGVIFSQLLLSKCLLIGFLCYNCIVSTIMIV